VEAITVGDPLAESTQMGPMIREEDAIRVERWIHEAVDGGARLISGGTRAGNLVAPSLVAEVTPGMRLSCEELFGPAVALTRFDTIEEAIALANDSRYGLSAGIFTRNLDWAMKFVRQVQCGNLMVNWGTQWRADLMPYGGLKGSGTGKEGPRYAVEEMTETKMVVMHL
jgi:acyl-CoA reductase-like NAD-dependent aldehyde dehydrogenase